MNNDEEEDDPNMRGKGAAEWANTILEFTSPIKLSNLLLPERDQNLQTPTFEKSHNYKIRLASTHQRRKEASHLIQDKFSWPEYSVADTSFEGKPNRITLITSLDDIIIGTITLCLDTPLGLDIDDTYRAEVDHLRASGRKLAEITDFATEGAFNNKRVMASIVHIAYIYARYIHDRTDFVIEVKARHASYYEKMLHFKRCGPEKLCSWALGSSVMLCLDIDHMLKQMEKFAGHFPGLRSEKSLYPYFFPMKMSWE